MPGYLSRIAFPSTVASALISSTALAQSVQAVPPPSGGSAASVSTRQQATPEASLVQEVVVTARRRSESLERTPVAVSALTSDAIQRQAIVSESDLQVAVPGLQVKQSQSSNQLNFSLRGQTVDAFSFSRPSVLPYFNEVQIGGSGATGFYDLQSIQVLKGPQGTLFGRNSTGGAVLFTSVKPGNQFGGYVAVRGGNYGAFEAEGAVNVPLVTDKALLRISGFTQSRNGFQYNLFDGSHLGTVRRQDGRVSLTLKPIDHLTNDLVVAYEHDGGNNVSSVVYNILPVGAPGAFVPNNIIYTPAADALFGAGFFSRFLAAHPRADPAGIVSYANTQRQRGPYIVNLDAPNFHKANNLIVTNSTTYEIGSDLQLRNIFGYTHLRNNDTSEFDGTPFPADSNGREGRGGTLRQVSEEVQALGKAFDKRLSYVLGFYFSDEDNRERSSSVILDILPVAPPINQINYGDTTNRTYAGYAQGTFDLADLTGVHGLGLTAGARYSSERVQFTHLPGDSYLAAPNPAFVNPESDTFNQLSWQIGVQDQVNSNLLLYVVSRRGNRSGGFNFFAPPVPGFGNNGGSEYRPEIATDVEGGVKYGGQLLGRPARVNLAVYNMWIDDIQRSNYVQIFGNLAGITVNVPSAEVKGVEADGVVNPTTWLSLGGSVNYTDARFTKNIVSVLQNPSVAFGPYPDTPRWSGSVFGEVSAPVSNRLRASVRGEVYGQSSTYFDSTANTLNPGSKIPGYAIANFRVEILDASAGVSLSANLKNAFDRTYYVGGIGFKSLLALNTVIPAEPRTFLIELRYKF